MLILILLLFLALLPNHYHCYHYLFFEVIYFLYLLFNLIFNYFFYLLFAFHNHHLRQKNCAFSYPLYFNSPHYLLLQIKFICLFYLFFDQVFNSVYLLLIYLHPPPQKMLLTYRAYLYYLIVIHFFFHDLVSIFRYLLVALMESIINDLHCYLIFPYEMCL